MFAVVQSCLPFDGEMCTKCAAHLLPCACAVQCAGASVPGSARVAFVLQE